MQNELHDITTHADVINLVDTFYDKVRSNPTLGFIFNDVARVNWPHHLPKMYAFWGGLLLGEHTYTGNPMTTHIELSLKTEMTENQFNTWLTLFTATVNQLFTGPKADEAKARAQNIAALMQHKIKMAQA